MLTLPIKKQWLDMILSGEKKEEYRAFNEYYTTRFMGLFGITWFNREIVRATRRITDEAPPVREICFRNGYSAKSPSIIAKCTLSVGFGKAEWGADEEKCYILNIIEITERKNLK